MSSCSPSSLPLLTGSTTSCFGNSDFSSVLCLTSIPLAIFSARVFISTFVVFLSITGLTSTCTDFLANGVLSSVVSNFSSKSTVSTVDFSFLAKSDSTLSNFSLLDFTSLSFCFKFFCVFSFISSNFFSNFSKVSFKSSSDLSTSSCVASAFFSNNLALSNFSLDFSRITVVSSDASAFFKVSSNKAITFASFTLSTFTSDAFTFSLAEAAIFSSTTPSFSDKFLLEVVSSDLLTCTIPDWLTTFVVSFAWTKPPRNANAAPINTDAAPILNFLIP